MWDALSDERTGLSFTTAAGPRQSSHSRVRVPRDSWLSRIPGSPLTVTQVKVKVMLRPTVSRPVYLGVKPHLGPKPRFLLQSDSCGFVHESGLSFTTAVGPNQRSHSQVRVLRDSWPYFTVSESRLPQSGGPGPRIHIALEYGGPVMAPGTGFPFCRLLRLAGLRWR
jgi:hypothetical protein